jgi:hypothetical protein
VKPLNKDGYASVTHAYEKPGHYIVTADHVGRHGYKAVTHLWVQVLG